MDPLGIGIATKPVIVVVVIPVACILMVILNMDSRECVSRIFLDRHESIAGGFNHFSYQEIRVNVSNQAEI